MRCGDTTLVSVTAHSGMTFDMTPGLIISSTTVPAAHVTTAVFSFIPLEFHSLKFLSLTNGYMYTELLLMPQHPMTKELIL